MRSETAESMHERLGREGRSSLSERALVGETVGVEQSQDSRIVETHLSRLIFIDDSVYKVKRAVKTGFIDLTERVQREQVCHREVELNARFAPDVYLGVVDLMQDGKPIDHMVVMKRLPEQRRLSALLDTPDVAEELRGIAKLIAAVHSTAERSESINTIAGYEGVRRLWEEGLEQIASYGGEVLPTEQVDRVANLALEYLNGRKALFDERISNGRACDGHGDIQAEDIFCLDDGPRLLDCLEFSDTFRFGDVLNDVAFLAMDLERLGHRDLAELFLGFYREFAGESWHRSLEHHYVAYRAHVRAKVACIRHDQGDPQAAELARRLNFIALEHLEAGRVRCVLVGGTPGTGKTSVSRELAQRLGAVVISSDTLRDELQPERTQGANDEIGAGRYEPSFIEAVYDEMLHQAELLVSRGESVVLDASWLDPTRRARALELGARTSTPVYELRCTCPEAMATERIIRRNAAGSDASEATPTIEQALRAGAAPWLSAFILDTAAPLGEVVSVAEKFLAGD